MDSNFGATDEQVDVYTSGECLQLAKALQQHLGGQIYAVVESGVIPGTSKNYRQHIHFVLLYNDSYIDVIKCWSAIELVTYWKEHQARYSQHWSTSRFELIRYNHQEVDKLLEGYSCPTDLHELCQLIIPQLT